MKVKSICTTRRAKIVIAVLWIVSALYAVPNAVIQVNLINLHVKFEVSFKSNNKMSYRENYVLKKTMLSTCASMTFKKQNKKLHLGIASSKEISSTLNSLAIEAMLILLIPFPGLFESSKTKEN